MRGMQYVLGLAFAVFVFFPNCTNRCFYESDIGLTLIGIFLAFKLRKIHWSVALMFLIASLSAILMTYYPDIYSRPLPDLYPLKISSTALDNYRGLLLFGILPFLVSADFFDKTLKFLFVATVLDSVWMIGRSILYGPDMCYAMLSNSAIDSSFIACLLPFAYGMIKTEYRKIGIFCIVTMLGAIIISRSSTGLGAIGVATAAYLLIEYGKKSLFIIVPLIPAVYASSLIYLHEELLNANGRYGVWKGAVSFFLTETHRAIGAGLGTFFFWGPEVQIHLGNSLGGDGKQALFIWMHNSWLQALFEMGVVGITGLIILYSFLLYKSWKKKNALFPAVVTYGFIGLTQMPLQLFVLQLLGVCLIILSFQTQTNAPN